MQQRHRSGAQQLIVELSRHIMVETPVKLTEHQRKLLKEFDESLRKGGSKHSPSENSWADKLTNSFKV